ncbi:MAG: SAM-dependent methyltransferase, partial [Pseudomonadota bacterium]
MTRPALTDRPALAAHRARATRQGHADFLHRATALDLQERVNTVNRRFTEIAVVSGFPELWAKLWPGARQVEDTEV